MKRHLLDTQYVNAFEMTTTWKRFFFKNVHFDSVDDLLRDVQDGGPASLWVKEVMEMRYRTEHRHSLEELREALSANQCPWWLYQLKPRLWNL